MKYIIKNIAYSMTCLAMILLMGSCNTDIEPVDINEPGIDKQNPELYAKYLTSLKAYKNSKHKVVLGWFDNSAKMPASQGQNIHSVPDSLDYIVLKYPADLNEREYKEITNLRQQKGTKVMYDISFETIKSTYDKALKAFNENPANQGKAFTAFNSWLIDSVQVKLALCDRYNYDGVVMSFEGKVTIYMTEAEKTKMLEQENVFIGIAKDWKERHTNKTLILAGKPQNITNQEIFTMASYIIIPCQSATTEGKLAYNMGKAAVEGVPTDKFIPMVSTTSLDATDLKTGYWVNNVVAVLGAAKWVASDHTGYQIAGLAIDNVNTDYYHANFPYPTVRKTISIINPTVKK